MDRSDLVFVNSAISSKMLRSMAREEIIIVDSFLVVKFGVFNVHKLIPLAWRREVALGMMKGILKQLLIRTWLWRD